MVGITRKTTLLFFLVLCQTFLLPPFVNWERSNISPTSTEPPIKLSSLGMDKPSNLPSKKEPRQPAGSNWVPFFTGAPVGTPPEIYLISSDHRKLMIGAKFYGMWNWSVWELGSQYNALEIPFTGHLTENGTPELPFITRFVEVPHDVNVEVSIKQAQSYFSTLTGSFFVRPFQGPWFPNHSLPSSIPNATIYGTNASFPASNLTSWGASASDVMVFRGRRIMALTIIPAQFNPVTKRISAYSEMVIELNYDPPAELASIDPRLYSPAFEELFRTFLLNPRPTVPSGPSSLSKKHFSSFSTPAGEYLIITTDEYQAKVKPLRDWKERKGFRTEIITVNELLNGWEPTEENKRDVIRQHIKDLYEEGDSVADYVLFVGDADDIPPCYDKEHTSDYHTQTLIGTDLFYFTVDGPDYIPDILYGRLSANTTEDVEAMVQKICDYEQDPPSIDTFYQQVTTVYTDLPSDFQVRADNFDALLKENHVTVELLTTQQQVDASFRDGRFLICYLGHGSSLNYRSRGQTGIDEGWTLPPFTTSDVATLDPYSDNKYPVVFSMCCDTGWYDGETDKNSPVDPFATLEDYDYDCFCENITRMAESGAVAAIGSCRHSSFGFNIYMLEGVLDALFPDIDPTVSYGETYSLGQLLWYGKMYLAMGWGYIDPYAARWDRTCMTFQMFQLFGDPEMTLHTQTPTSLNVEFPANIGSAGPQSFVITVTDDQEEPVGSAIVCLQKETSTETEVYDVQRTTSDGYAFFDITPPRGGPMNITVTKHNYRPYNDTITVTPGGAIVSVDPTDDSVGGDVTLSGYQFSYQSQLLDGFFGKVPITEELETIGGELPPSIVSVPYGVTGPVNIIISEIGGRAAVVLFNRYKPGEADPYLYCQEDFRTWNLNPKGMEGDVNPRWDNPDIEIIRPQEQHILTYLIRADIHNDGPEKAWFTNVRFSWSPLGVGERTWIPISTEVEHIPAHGVVTVPSAAFSATTSLICVRVEVEYSDDIRPENNVGFECFLNRTVMAGQTFVEDVELIIHDSDNPTSLSKRDITGTALDPLMFVEVDGPFPSTSQSATIKLYIGANAPVGANRTILIQAEINNVIIGGLEVFLMVAPPPGICWICILIPILIVLVIIVLVVRWWRKRD